MRGHALGSYVMMRLGSFSFGISTAAYQQLTSSTEYKWPSQERFGKPDALQYTGPGQETKTLSGVVFTEYRGGTGQIEILRAVAAQGRPQMLISGTGSILGQWVVEMVEETQSVFAAKGIPRRQEFTVQLRKYGDNIGLPY